MDVARDPLSTLLGGLSLLNDGSIVQLRYQPNAGERMRWLVHAAGDGGSVGHGDTALEAITSAYRSSVADLEAAVQRQVNDAMERSQ